MITTQLNGKALTILKYFLPVTNTRWKYFWKLWHLTFSKARNWIITIFYKSAPPLENLCHLKEVISEYWMNHHWLESRSFKLIKLNLEKSVTSVRVQASMLSENLNWSDWYIIIPIQKPSKLLWRRFPIYGLLS